MKNKKTRITESGWASLARYTRSGLDIITTIYMLLIIVWMPFYFEEGYNHIGSDKSYFFRTYSTYVFKIFLPVLALYLVFLLIDLFYMGKTYGMKEYLLQGLKKTRFTIIDLFVAGYGLTVILSYAFSEYKETAIWGTSGWYMGMFPQLILVGIYFAVSLFWKRKDWVVYLILPISAIEFILGYLNRFNVWPIEMENSGRADFISTIGNINWFCGYMICTMFLGIGMFWLDNGKKKWKTALLAAYVFISIGMMIVEGSESGLFALGLVILVMFTVSALRMKKNPERMERFWQIALLSAGSCIFSLIVRVLFPDQILHWGGFTSVITEIATHSVAPFLLAAMAGVLLWLAYLQRKNEKLAAILGKIYKAVAIVACVAVVVGIITLATMITINTKNPGSLGALSDNPVFTFSGDWASNRGAPWKVAIMTFRDQDFLHKLFGIGPDCMSDYIYQGGNMQIVECVTEVFGDLRLTNAHCEMLTLLACCGILGAVFFAGILACTIWGVVRLDGKSPTATGCALCMVAYIFNNVWSFQQSMSVASIFIIIGIAVNCLRYRDEL